MSTRYVWDKTLAVQKYAQRTKTIPASDSGVDWGNKITVGNSYSFDENTGKYSITNGRVYTPQNIGTNVVKISTSTYRYIEIDYNGTSRLFSANTSTTVQYEWHLTPYDDSTMIYVDIFSYYNGTSSRTSCNELYSVTTMGSGSHVGYVSGNSQDSHESGLDSTGQYYLVYLGYDSIDPKSVTYGTDKFDPGESVQVIVTPTENILGGTVFYQYQYSITAGNTWANSGDPISSTRKEIVIPEDAKQFMARVLASDDCGFTSETYVTGSNFGTSAMAGGYLLFAGGQTAFANTSCTNTVDAYNSSLTHSTPTTLSAERTSFAGTSIGGYALFGGGINKSNAASDVVDAYNNVLTRTTPTSLSIARSDLSATSNKNYAIFAGGRASGASPVVDAYNKNLGMTIATQLNIGIYKLSATNIGDYAIFAGGYDGLESVYAYNSSLTRSNQDGLSLGRYNIAATTITNYALFAGGHISGGYANNVTNVVEAYNDNLTKTIVTELSIARDRMGATSLGNYALFGGGYSIDNAVTSAVDVYDSTLTRTINTDLSLAKDSLSAGTIGVYALFAGGESNNQQSDIVDVYRHI